MDKRKCPFFIIYLCSYLYFCTFLRCSKLPELYISLLYCIPSCALLFYILHRNYQHHHHEKSKKRLRLLGSWGVNIYMCVHFYISRIFIFLVLDCRVLDLLISICLCLFIFLVSDCWVLEAKNQNALISISFVSLIHSFYNRWSSSDSFSKIIFSLIWYFLLHLKLSIISDTEGEIIMTFSFFTTALDFIEGSIPLKLG